MSSFQLTSRRDFLKATALGAAALSAGLPNLLAAGKKVPVGLQLYSIREAFAKDPAKTLKAVADIGFKGVEFAGYNNLSAKELRKMLDDNGLVCCGTHTGLETLQPDKIDATIEFNQVLGNKFLICPYMEAHTKQGWLDLAKLFNQQAIKAKAAKMQVGYHAHKGDFTKVDGETYWDLFFGNTTNDVVMQLDTSNCKDGGADPVEVLKKYPKRGATIHIKEWGGAKDAVIGQGEVNFPAVFELCEKSGITKWYVVEHEREGDAIENVRRCFEGMKKLGKV